MTDYDPAAARREDEEMHRRLIRRIEADLAARRKAIAQTEQTLYQANLRDFRAAMMALFDAHPALDTVRIDQVSRYNDEFVQFGIEEIWVNGQYARAGSSIVGGYDAGSSPSIYTSDSSEDDLWFRTDATDEYGYPKEVRGQSPQERLDAVRPVGPGDAWERARPRVRRP